MRLSITLLLVFLLLVPIGLSHGAFLVDLELDFDPILERGVTVAAQDFIGSSEQPFQFDYERELIIVQFQRDYEFFVIVNPVDFSIHGFRDNSKISEQSLDNYDAEQRKEIAQGVFDKIPEKYRSQLRYGEERKDYTGTYRHIWYRYVDSILVANDVLEVEVDPTSGEVVTWKLSLFYSKPEHMTLNPAFSADVAQAIGELFLNAEATDQTPFLIIEKNKPTWVVNVKALYPTNVGIDALTGEIIWTGPPRAIVPKGYSVGPEVEVVQNDYIRGILEG